MGPGRWLRTGLRSPGRSWSRWLGPREAAPPSCWEASPGTTGPGAAGIPLPFREVRVPPGSAHYARPGGRCARTRGFAAVLWITKSRSRKLFGGRSSFPFRCRFLVLRRLWMYIRSPFMISIYVFYYFHS